MAKTFERTVLTKVEPARSVVPQAAASGTILGQGSFKENKAALQIDKQEWRGIVESLNVAHRPQQANPVVLFAPTVSVTVSPSGGAKTGTVAGPQRPSRLWAIDELAG